MYSKFKNLLNPTNFIQDKYSVNALVKSIVALNYEPSIKNQTLLYARLAYLSQYRYNRNISQAERIVLSNLLVHSSEKTVIETPHLIYHTLNQESRLQVIPDRDIFNIRDWKYGDFVNINTEKAIEVKTSDTLSQQHLYDLKDQYNLNKRNENFIFSCFYNKLLNMTENYVREFLLTELKLEQNQLVMKSFDSLTEHFTDGNIKKAIGYYDISWLEYQTENNDRLRLYLDNLLQNAKLDINQKRKVRKFLRAMDNSKSANKDLKLKYPYKDTTLLLDDKTVIDPLDSIELTPEEIMSDQTVIEFNEDSEKEKTN